MNPKKAARELEKQLRKQPGSLVLRIRLASALHAIGRLPEAVDLYRSVAMAYFAQGRLEQAIAVCHSLLEIAPMHQDTHLLLAELDSHRARRAQEGGGEAHADALAALGTGAMPAWPGPEGAFPLAGGEPGAGPPATRRETGGMSFRETGSMSFRETGGLARRETGPAVWRETGPFGRRDTSGLPPWRDTPDPGSGPITTPGPASAIAAGLPFGRDGSVASRLPLPVVRTTLTGLVPAPGERGASEPGATSPTARYRRPSESLAPTRPPGARPPPFLPRAPSQAEADEDAPTHIADRWVSPFSAEVGAAAPVVPPPGGGAPFAGRSHSSSGVATNKMYGGPVGSTRLPTYRARPRRPLGDSGDGAGAGAASGEPAEPTQYDDGMELARALGRSYGMGDDSGLDTPGRVPLLSGLSERSVEAIAAGMVRRRVTSGELIVRDGEPGDSCFVLARGEARVLRRDPLLPRGDLVEVSRLGDSDLFGEVAMLGDRRRHASVQAITDCELLEIPRSHLVLVGRRFPEVEAFLQQFYRERLIATLVSTASFFRPLDLPQRTGILAHFRFSHVESGAPIVGEGERAGGFFLIVQGSVEITKRVSERRQVLLATLGEGTYFGEMSLLRGEVARASVTATGATDLAMLPAKNFYALVANHPVLWDQVRQEAHRRELEMVQIVTGITGTV